MQVFKINNNIMKYTFGVPIDTEVISIKGEKTNDKFPEFLNLEELSDLKISYDLDKYDIVWGLGENQRGMNKRGGIYESFCSDDPNHTPNKKSLYGAHNFIIIDGKNKFGIFIDFPGKVIFDIGFYDKNKLKIAIEENNTGIYLVKGNSPREIVKEFLNIIGTGYTPPKWAFGYQQSRWSYKNSKVVDEIADKFIENKIPCDAIYLDIDYMERFKDFTVDKDAFKDFKRYVEKIKNKGFRLIPIIDAGIKIEEGYKIYEEGIENKYFCFGEDGKPFIAAVWPGRCHFPDFLNKNAREWFGAKYKVLTDLGVEGFWNDMNEPALFYTDRGLKEAIEAAKASENKNLDIYSCFELKDKFTTMSNNVEDYKSFYHNMDGKIVNHYKVHNLYGYNMTRSASEGLKKINPNKRFLLFSRASYIGMHKFAGIWTGDNHSWWEHILLNIKMMPSLNMCGFYYIGADTGGFNCDANSDLVIRWSQFSLFTPLFRNHSALGTRDQEPFSFDKDTIKILRKTIEFRYAIIPYIYSEYMKAIINKDMYFLPLSFEYNDEFSTNIENQLIIGDSIMITPIYEENTLGRYIYLPEDMALWRVKDYKNRQYKIMKKGHAYIDVSIEEIPVFIRKNKMIVLGKPAKNVESIDNSKLDIIAFVQDEAQYTYYDDDGFTYGYRNGDCSKLIIKIKRKEDKYIIDVKNEGNDLVKKLNFEIIDIYENIYKETVSLM